MNQLSNSNIKKIYLGNFDCEEYWNDCTSLKLPYIDFRHIKTLLQYLGELFIFFADKNDVVILREQPNEKYLDYLKSLEVTIPKIMTLCYNDDDFSFTDLVLKDTLLIMKLRNIIMNDWHSGTETFLVPYGNTIKEAILSDKIAAKKITNHRLAGLFNNKLYLKQLLSELKVPSPESIICNGIDDLYINGLEFINKHKHVVTKELYGSGGSGLRRFDSVEQFETEMSYIRKKARSDGAIIMEKWYESICSYNYQYMVLDYDVFFYTCSQQLIDKNGYIIGSFFDLKKVDRIIKIHNDYGYKIAREMARVGYRGIVGFDSIVCESKEMFPVIDINCRINLSTVFYEILTKYFKTQYACFFYKEYGLDEPIEFDRLIKKIEPSAYSSTTQEGIVILNYATLNQNIVSGRGKIGRVFYGIFSNEKQRIKIFYDRVFKSVGTFDEFTE